MLKQNADHTLVSMVTGEVQRCAAVTVDGINLHHTHTHHKGQHTEETAAAIPTHSIIA